MSQFKSTYLEIEPNEIAKYLLEESGSFDKSCVDIENLLTFLKLKSVEMDFDKEFSGLLSSGKLPRAMISFPDQIIAVQEGLYSRRKRFCILHEIAHYVLPEHRHDLFICSNKDFGLDTDKTWESEANSFAADLLFLSGMLEKEANQSATITPKLVKELGDKYDASYEATVRRLSHKSLKPYMLLVLQKNETNDDWQNKYCVPSKTFKVDYFSNIMTELPGSFANEIMALSDISESIEAKNAVETSNGPIDFNMVFFTNRINIFVLINPL